MFGCDPRLLENSASHRSHNSHNWPTFNSFKWGNKYPAANRSLSPVLQKCRDTLIKPSILCPGRRLIRPSAMLGLRICKRSWRICQGSSGRPVEFLSTQMFEEKPLQEDQKWFLLSNFLGCSWFPSSGIGDATRIRRVFALFPAVVLTKWKMMFLGAESHPAG